MIENYLTGTTVVNMLPAQDHKRIFDNDLGPNTGGMGAYCPCPFLNEEEQMEIKKKVLQKAVDGLKNENIPFVGKLLYFYLIICRFIDFKKNIIDGFETGTLFLNFI